MERRRAAAQEAHARVFASCAVCRREWEWVRVGQESRREGAYTNTRTNTYSTEYSTMLIHCGGERRRQSALVPLIGPR